ncbi:MAG: hypothetical protein KKD83_03510 [Chloroflexi bacterium]|nr:hypothetical protein [Chloroflexota bacterium]
MLDYIDYAIDGDGYQGNGNGYHGNGYNKLDGDYALFYKVAKGFTHRVKREDTQDFLHDLLMAMARVKATYTAKGKELTTGGLVRVAQYEVADYWRKRFKRINGIDCSRCSKAQREKCKDWFLYPDCPKAVKLERLDRVIDDGNGNETALHELIADDNAVDLVAMLDARFTLNGYPTKAVKLAYKRYAGYPLDKAEQNYFTHFRKRTQKRLV